MKQIIAFDEALAQLAKNINTANKEITSINKSYANYSECKRLYKEQVEQSERLYMETLKTIEKICEENETNRDLLEAQSGANDRCAKY